MSTGGSAAKCDGISIRRATNADIPAIRAVLHTVRDEYGVVVKTITDPDLDDLEQNYFRRGGYFEVIEDKAHRIVGCAGLYPLTDRRAELCKMYLEKTARGRGLGKRLLENLLAAARQAGFAEVWLETNSVLTAAITLYRRYGFQPIPGNDLLASCDEAYLLKLE